MKEATAALKLALEALETYKGFIDDAHIVEGQWHWIDGLDNVQTTIKEALAQDEQSSSQEPVAFISPGGHIHYDPYLDSVPLYTAPPKRPWVGLTDEQRNYCVETPFVSQQWANIEDKLRELNT